MSVPEERLVCDLTLLMRARLLCGLFSRRAVPLRWRCLARAYCLTLTVAVACMIYLFLTSPIPWAKSLGYLIYLPVIAQLFVALVVSLWSGDEYIHKFFTLNRLTDITLDSSAVFNRLQKRLTQWMIYIAAYHLVFTATYWWMFAMATDNSIFNVLVMGVTFATTLLELIVACSYASKFLIMSLFNARMLVLKRRLQRYGFRALGRAPPQPYCQVYDEIWQMLDATDNPLKVLLFFDLIFSTAKLILVALLGLYQIKWNLLSTIQLIVFIPHVVFCSFGHVAQLDSAAAHCDEMAVFTATQLIKNPTNSERQRMREFLNALHQRGARYHVLRALPLDACFVLRVLGFVTAQAIIFADAVMAE